MSEKKNEKPTLDESSIETERKVGRRSALTAIGVTAAAGALAVATGGCGGGSAAVETGTTDSDPTDAAGAGTGGGETGVTDGDPTDAAGEGRPAVTDSDPTDSVGEGNTGMTDSDPTDSAEHGRGEPKGARRGHGRR